MIRLIVVVSAVLVAGLAAGRAYFDPLPETLPARLGAVATERDGDFRPSADRTESVLRRDPAPGRARNGVQRLDEKTPPQPPRTRGDRKRTQSRHTALSPTYVPIPRPSPIPGAEPPGNPVEDLIAAMIEDGAPETEIARIERSFNLTELSPEERRKAEAEETQTYTPPSPEDIEGLILHAHEIGAVSDTELEPLLEAHWRRVEEDARRRADRAQR